MVYEKTFMFFRFSVAECLDAVMPGCHTLLWHAHRSNDNRSRHGDGSAEVVGELPLVELVPLAVQVESRIFQIADRVI